MIFILCAALAFFAGLSAILGYNCVLEHKYNKTLGFMLQEALLELRKYAPDKVEFVREDEDE